MAETAFRPRFGRGLSARILLLTCLFVLLGEVLIYLPSIARFRLAFLEERLAAAELAALALDAAPESCELSTIFSILAARRALRAVDIGGAHWYDIDTGADLEAAAAMLAARR